MNTSILEHFHKQAYWCRKLGSPLTGDVVEALAHTLDTTSETGMRILSWAGDPEQDALSIRIAGGMHALARRRSDAELSAFYRGEGGDAAEIVPRVVAENDLLLSHWLNLPPQTNEVARSGALWPGIMTIAQRFGSNIELLELGASAGLNLNLDRFSYDLAGIQAGDATSIVRICPEWSGGSPPVTPVNVVSRVGVDRDPVNLANSTEVEKLTSFVWAGMSQRMNLIESAIALAIQYPPHVEQGDLVDWMEAQLEKPQPAGVTRVFFHSVVFQYISKAARTTVEKLLSQAGERATTECPLARLQMEMIKFDSPLQLRLQSWPGSGRVETLAYVHPHGTKVNWVY